MSDSSRKRSWRRSSPIAVVAQPWKMNDTPSVRRTGDRVGCRNRSLIAGLNTQIAMKQAAPRATPAVEAARMSSLESSGFCTRAEASPIRAKSCAKSTTRLASAMSPKAVGSSSREMTAVYTRLTTMSVANPR